MKKNKDLFFVIVVVIAIIAVLSIVFLSTNAKLTGNLARSYAPAVMRAPPAPSAGMGGGVPTQGSSASGSAPTPQPSAQCTQARADVQKYCG